MSGTLLDQELKREHAETPRHRHPLDYFFEAQSVAVIGASEKPDSVGRSLMLNLLDPAYRGKLFPVNLNHERVLGVKAYAKVTDLPETPDLAVIATPAATVPDIIRECAAAGIKAAVIVTAGFKEIGPDGAQLEQRILAEARRGDVRLIGPNCLGFINPAAGLNVSFASAMAKVGHVAFLSQSGALMTAVLDWSLRKRIGFSGFVSVGSMLDVCWADLIDYYGDDPQTKAILLYFESIGDARRFVSAARRVALNKPIIVIKPGRTQQAARAAASHTGAMIGSDDVVEAALQQCGVLRVNTVSDLFYIADILAHQPRPRGPRLAIVTNAGGPGVLATDALIANGGELANLSVSTIQQLNAVLPSAWSHSNPADLLGDAGADRYAKAIDIVLADPHTDGVLVVLTPQSVTKPRETADVLCRIAKLAKDFGKPILASWMGADAVADGQDALTAASIPSFAFPDTAARMYAYLWRHALNLRQLRETPSSLPNDASPRIDRSAASRIIESVWWSNRTLLSEHEGKLLLASYAIQTAQTRLAADADLAAAAADEIGYPVVLKLHSYSITHKAEIGGVKLNLADRDAVAEAYRSIQAATEKAFGKEAFKGVSVQKMTQRDDGLELIVGSCVNPDFGPVLLFGAGGGLVEVLHDRVLALPPINAATARRLIERSRIFPALKGLRSGRSVDIHQLEQLLVRFSQLVVEQRRIKEIEINPLLVGADQILALDARVVLYPPATPEAAIPRLAIRPYPSRYVISWTSPDGVPGCIRPIRPEDEPMLRTFHEGLSEQTVRERYFGCMSLESRVTHERLSRICLNDYDRELVLVAEEGIADGQRRILGVGRISRLPGTSEADVSVLVGDKVQDDAIGKALLDQLIWTARGEGVATLRSCELRSNSKMQQVLREAGFTLSDSYRDSTVRGRMQLNHATSLQ